MGSFRLQARGVERMWTYADATRRYGELTPSRYGGRCLSRNKDLWIIKDGADTYHCIYKVTTCVSYYPDGRIVLNCGGWVTPSTAQFIYACCGIMCVTKSGKMYVVAKGPDGKLGYFVFGHPEILNGVIQNPVQEQRKVLDKDKAKEIRARFKPFVDNLMHIVPAITPSLDLQYGCARVIEGTKSYDPGSRLLWTQAPSHHALLELTNAIFAEPEVATAYILYHSMKLAPMNTSGDIIGWNIKPTVQTLLREMYRTVYIQEKAWVYEDVPLGEIAKKDLL